MSNWQLYWKFLVHFFTFLILGLSTILPIVAPRCLPDGSPYASIVYYGATIISVAISISCPWIPAPPLNPCLVFLSFGSIIYTVRGVFGTHSYLGRWYLTDTPSGLLRSGVLSSDHPTLDLSFRLVGGSILFILIEILYSTLLVLLLDEENWGIFRLLHTTITRIPLVMATVLTWLFNPVYSIAEWLSHCVEWLSHCTNEQENTQRVSLELDEEIDGELPPPYFKVK